MLNKVRGFTLIELMIAVAIVGILAAIAYPGYQSQVKKTRRSDAKVGLSQAQNYMERFFTEHNCYRVDCTGTPSNPNIGSQISGDLKNYYDFSFSSISTSSYTLQAVPKTGTPQENDSCGTLTLSNTGAKTPSTAGCW